MVSTVSTPSTCVALLVSIPLTILRKITGRLLQNKTKQSEVADLAGHGAQGKECREESGAVASLPAEME